MMEDGQVTTPLLELGSHPSLAGTPCGEGVTGFRAPLLTSSQAVLWATPPCGQVGRHAVSVHVFHPPTQRLLVFTHCLSPTAAGTPAAGGRPQTWQGFPFPAHFARRPQLRLFSFPHSVQNVPLFTPRKHFPAALRLMASTTALGLWGPFEAK